MPVFQCNECDGITCIAVVNCNDDEFITNPDDTCDDLGCIRRVMIDKAVWRRPKVI